MAASVHELAPRSSRRGRALVIYTVNVSASIGGPFRAFS